ncbi:MAG: hypothetical protein M3290_14045, partial [Actinomycetota bacterium]|nr:hypothetical protein [Actinomycetota bacterium]
MALVIVVMGSIAPSASARTQRRTIPSYVKPALSGLVTLGAINRPYFRPNQPMSRRRFGHLLRATFGTDYRSADGKITAQEVDAALVAVLGQKSAAAHLNHLQSADGWHPQVGRHFGTEVVARDLGLRYDHGTTDEQHEAAATDPMTQADILYAVWQAKTSPDVWAAEQLEMMTLPNLSASQRNVIQFGFSLAGTPYVWGGEWPSRTPAGYPYGPQ